MKRLNDNKFVRKGFYTNFTEFFFMLVFAAMVFIFYRSGFFYECALAQNHNGLLQPSDTIFALFPFSKHITVIKEKILDVNSKVNTFLFNLYLPAAMLLSAVLCVAGFYYFLLFRGSAVGLSHVKVITKSGPVFFSDIWFLGDMVLLTTVIALIFSVFYILGIDHLKEKCELLGILNVIIMYFKFFNLSILLSSALFSVYSLHLYRGVVLLTVTSKHLLTLEIFSFGMKRLCVIANISSSCLVLYIFLESVLTLILILLFLREDLSKKAPLTTLFITFVCILVIVDFYPVMPHIISSFHHAFSNYQNFGDSCVINGNSCEHFIFNPKAWLGLKSYLVWVSIAFCKLKSVILYIWLIISLIWPVIALVSDRNNRLLKDDMYYGFVPLLFFLFGLFGLYGVIV